MIRLKTPNTPAEILVLLSSVALLLCMLFSSSYYNKFTLQQNKKEIVTKLNTYQNEFSKYYNKHKKDLTTTSHLPIEHKDFEPYFNKAYSVQYYENGDIVNWSSRDFLPNSVVSNLKDEGKFIISYNKRYYYIFKQKLLNNHIVAYVLPISDTGGTVMLDQKNYQPITFSKKLIELNTQSLSISEANSFFKFDSNKRLKKPLILIISWFCFVFLSIWAVFETFHYPTLNNYLVEFALILLSFTILAHFFDIDFFDVFQEFETFKPRLWANKYIGKSVGHLFLKLIMVAAIVVIWYKRKLFVGELLPRLNNQLKLFFYAIVVAIASFALLYFFRSSVLDSNNVVYFFITRSPSSYFIIICLLTAGFVYNVFLLRIIRYNTRNFKKNSSKIAFTVTVGLVLFLLLKLVNTTLVSIVFSLFICGLLMVLFFIFNKNNKLLSLWQIIAIILYFSLISTYFLQTYSKIWVDNRLKQVARKIVQVEDFEVIYELDLILEKIAKDKSLPTIMSSPFSTKSTLEKRLQKLYLNDILDEYQQQINVKEVLASSEEYEQHKTSYINPVKGDHDFYVFKSFVPIQQTKDKIIGIEIDLKKSKFASANKYGLIERSQGEYSFLKHRKLSYYILERGKVIDVKGNINGFDPTIPQELPIGTLSLIDRTDGRNNYAYKYMDNGLLFLSIKIPKIADNSINTLAYVFSIILYFYLLIVYLYSGFNLSNLEFFRRSIANRVQFYVLAIVYLSSFFIAAFTIKSASGEIGQLQEERSSNFLQTIKQEFVNTDNSVTHEQLRENFTSYIQEKFYNSNEHIHFFDNEGKLMYSNQEILYEDRIWPSYMNPYAYFLFQQSPKQIQTINEEINGSTYKGYYFALKDKALKTAGYLYYPDFESQFKQEEEQGVLSNLFFNTFSFVLFIFTFLSLILTNSFRNILERIRKQISMAELGKQHEQIEWKNKDEIGLLIQEYNDMVLKLDESAVVLARTERESAWRDMAKQIAHEIKNPLTPMKLSIQHLKRRLEMNPTSDSEKIIKTLDNLVVQINHLTNIAGDFSSIAKMEEIDLQKVDLKQLLDEVNTIFQHNPSYSFDYQVKLANKNAIVFADKTKINRVFTNLLKNSTQALATDRPGRIVVKIEETDIEYIVSVTDNGKGIPLASRARIFTPNFTTKKSGTGIGLMMSKKIIELHNGSIAFESKEDIGTSFYVKLPKYNTNETF